MTYRVTTECGAYSHVTRETYLRFVRQAGERGWECTRVPKSVVVTLPSGALLALIRVGA